jgi:hypothetical protein
MIAWPVGSAGPRMCDIVALDGRLAGLFVAYLDPNATFFEESSGVCGFVGADFGHYNRSQTEADDRPRTHLARHHRGVTGRSGKQIERLTVTRPGGSVADRLHLRVGRGIARLGIAIETRADHLAILDDHGSNGKATFFDRVHGLLVGCGKMWIHGLRVLGRAMPETSRPAPSNVP